MALRDTFFPESLAGAPHDLHSAASRQRRQTPLDDAMEDEGSDGFEARKAVRDWLLDAAAAAGLPALYALHPTAVRYGFAAVVGVVLLLVVVSVQAASAACTRVVLAALLKYTGDPAWENGEDGPHEYRHRADSDEKRTNHDKIE